MPKLLRVRALTPAEGERIKHLAHSRTEPARLVERAQIIWLSHEGRRVRAIARELGVSRDTVRLWLKRFEAEGLDGLADKPRPGAPPTYTPEQIGEVIAAALTDPRSLGLPFASWTVSRLEAYLNEEKGIPIKHSRIDEILIAEGLRWRMQETWFSEQAAVERAQPSTGEPPTGEPAPTTEPAGRSAEGEVDPGFAPKRGPSSGCIPTPRPAASR